MINDPQELPSSLEYFNKNLEKTENIENNLKNKKFEMFYTKKNTEYLPELILCFTKEEICLYGYPFTLLENAEIINTGNLSSIDVIKFINIFEKFNKISKRFGK